MKNAADADTTKARVYIRLNNGEYIVEEFETSHAAEQYMIYLPAKKRAAYRAPNDATPVLPHDYVSAE